MRKGFRVFCRRRRAREIEEGARYVIEIRRDEDKMCGREVWLNMVEYGERRKASVTGKSAAVVRGEEESVGF